MDNWSRLFVSHVCSDIVNENVPIGEGSMETAYSSSPDVQIDDSDDENFVMGTKIIDGRTNVTQNTSDAYNPNNE